MDIPAGLKSQIAKQSAAGIAAAMLIALPFICGHEGDSLESYQDGVGIWTICNGETAGVTRGMTKTPAECDDFTKSTVGQFMAAVAGKLKVTLPPPTLAAHTSFAYNIGMAGYDISSTLRLTNAGHIEEGCRAMMAWHTAGGRDCRDRSNNCYGLITRRNDEIALCLSGVGQKKETP